MQGKPQLAMKALSIMAFFFYATGSSLAGEATAPRWDITEKTSAVDGKKTIYATLNAYSVDGDQAKGKSARLTLMCSGTFTGVFIATDFYLSDLYEMTIRINQSDPTSGVDHWSTYHQTMLALSLPDDIQGFMRSLKDDGELAIRTVTSQDGFEAVFRIGEYRQTAAKVATACGWKL